MKSLAEQLRDKIHESAVLYHRLVVFAAPAGFGKTTVLREISAQGGGRLLNVNLEISRRMLELTERQRALYLQRLLTELVKAAAEEVILLDNTEILFAEIFNQDPLRLLLGLSRNKNIVISWNGSVIGGYLVYAVPGHPEYKRYPLGEMLVVTPETLP